MTGLSFVKLRGFVALLYHAPKRDTRESGRNPPGFQGAQRPPPPSAAEEGRPQHLDQHLAEGDPWDLLSRFFRVVLSKGRAVVSLQEELSCIQSYLYIQKVRYADILNYEIQAEPEALDCRIQKLSLQPLVENALYHGIEKKRGGPGHPGGEYHRQ